MAGVLYIYDPVLVPYWGEGEALINALQCIVGKSMSGQDITNRERSQSVQCNFSSITIESWVYARHLAELCEENL